MDTGAWEREIDGLVYELYGLTEDEVKVVEGGVWKQPSKTYLLSLYVVPVLQKTTSPLFYKIFRPVRLKKTIFKY